MKLRMHLFCGQAAGASLLAGCLMAMLLVAGARADDVTLSKDNASGESWATAANWSNSKAAEAGHDYFVAKDRSGAALGGKVLRTPTSDATFPGDSLSINAGGTLAIKSTTPGNKYTFNNLIMDGSSFGQYSDNSTATLQGNIALSGNCSIPANGANIRCFIFEAALSGSGKVTMTVGSDDGIYFNSDTNTYSGEYVHNGGPVWVRKSGALGAPTTYTLAQAGRLNIQAPLVLGQTALQITSTAAVLSLASDAHFKALKVMGKTVAEGTYHAADMTTWPTQFTGSGTLTIGAVNPVRKAWLFN